MTIPAWTFLISRNQSIDYKTVVAPDFISQAKIRSLLLKVTDEDLTESENTNIREVYNSEVGNFTVFFRSIKARSKDIGEKGNEVLKDSFGREIYRIEGLVFQKRQRELSSIIGKIHLTQAHEELQEKYREFWYEDKLSVSRKIELAENTSALNNNLTVLEPFIATSKPNLRALGTQKRFGQTTNDRNKNARNIIDISLFLMIALAILFLMNALVIQNHSSTVDICLYKTEVIPLNSQVSVAEPKLLKIDKLQSLRNEKKTAWIWLNGNLKLQSSEIDEIKKSVSENEEKATLKTQNDDTLTMNNHPIDAAIALLQDKEIVGGELNATIIEPSSSENSSCTIFSPEKS
jgi:hypothetical protein